MATLEELEAQRDAAQKEAERLDKLIEQERAKGPEVIALYEAMRDAIKRLKAKAPELLHESIMSIPGQQWPKAKQIAAKRYKMSETEIHNAEERGRKAVDAL